MSQTTSVPSKTFEEILSKLDQLTREVHIIKMKLFDVEPAYRSDEWWDWSNKKALEDIKQGRFSTVQDKKELNVFLDSLKS